MQTSRTFEKLVDAWWKKPRYIDSEGGTRSGKTYSALQLFVIVVRSDKAPTINSVVSESLPHLKRGAIRDFAEIMENEGLWDESAWNRSDKIYTFPNGSILEFFGADSPGKVHGPSRDRLFLNEAQNIKWEVARQLFVRTRGVIVFDYNPTAPFWAHERIKQRDNCVSIHSTYLDNPFLTAEQVAEIEANRSDSNWWRVYGEGKVGRLEGLIYDMQMIDAMPAKSDGMVETYGLDFGFTNDPTACVHCLIDTRKRELYIEELFYQRGLLNKDIVSLLKQSQVPKNSVPIFADAAEPKSIAELAQYGFNVKPCYKATKITEQIAFIQQYTMYVTKRSLELIKEGRGYVWQTDKDGRSLNVPIAFNDHSMDAMRYAVFTPFSKGSTKAPVINVGRV